MSPSETIAQESGEIKIASTRIDHSSAPRHDVGDSGVRIGPSESESPSDETDPEDYYFNEDRTLYVAEAMEDSSLKRYQGVEDLRGGFPILVFKVGNRIDVEHEEADQAEGGCGWLLGRKHGDGVLGWVRTELFTMLDDDDEL
ncbi:BQ5605_C025g10049 [Microbotryum silenes-dioicae]|uniref:BQ5605_C025g10049 protein n=1 Tax=Microbotryum silenes-dioicae TaxID=796604 RepID=A0A2X0MMF5_9BASI|nr:BQ5605_C025g10049 [Microbotryum silenes-dioicae]